MNKIKTIIKKIRIRLYNFFHNKIEIVVIGPDDKAIFIFKFAVEIMSIDEMDIIDENMGALRFNFERIFGEGNVECVAISQKNELNLKIIKENK